jgi:glycosyltransferase involved in cell wall biosynthesis
MFSLKKIIARQGIDVIHCHQDNDALTTVAAGLGHQMVRTCYDGQPADLNFRQRISYRHAAQIMTASHRVGDYLSAKYPHKNIEQVDIPVDLDNFHPMPKNERLLKEFGLTPRDAVAGIVARVQKHRNFPLLIEALVQIAREFPQLKFLIVGRGTLIDTIARQPVEEKGLQDRVIFTGYRNEDYRDVLNLFDFKVFLHPGSDGACRAVREAMACGKPVVAVQKGILPELIKDGQTGLLIDENPQALARAMITLFRDDQQRLKLGRAARAYAQDALNPQRYLKKVAAAYESVVAT